MLVYSRTKDDFRTDVFSNRIEDVIHSLYRTKFKKSVAASELQSWRNSMQYMDRVLEDDEIPGDATVSIEYGLPQSSKRIDFILSGKNPQNQDSVVIVELKQWSSVEVTTKDAIVKTILGGGFVETTHPSYQALTYASFLRDFNATVQEDDIQITPCAYLHNCSDSTAVRAPFYSEHLQLAPVFLQQDAVRLREFLKKHVKFGDSSKIMFRIDQGKIRPSKHLADSLVSMLEGNREFLMIDDQKLVYETALELAGLAQTGKRQVLIVNGGPGTGKSVVAINLLVELTQRELVTMYVSKNAAPRSVYESKLVGHMKKSHITNLFKGSGSFTETEAKCFDALIVDEAHRLNEKSGLYQNLGENQIKEIIESSKLSIFFLDEDQRVTLNDIGDNAEIRRWAVRAGAQVTDLSLSSQFRCNGSDGYLAWVDHALQVRETANVDLSEIDYEFAVCDSPSELRDRIFELNRRTGRARLVAGYCWPWVSKKDASKKDIVFPDTDFAMQWNLTTDGSLWIVKDSSLNEVGCIHTCQGLELDYVGVIIGKDFVIRDGVVKVDATERAKADRTVFGFKKLQRNDPLRAQQMADRIIKNTYRTLMTRGQKGCLIYCVDEETRDHFRSMLGQGSNIVESAAHDGLPWEIMNPEDIRPYENCLPIFRSADDLHPDCDPTQLDWVRVGEPFVAKKGYFIAQMVGDAMNKRVPSGAWCLFKTIEGLIPDDRIVLWHHETLDLHDPSARYAIRSCAGWSTESRSSVRLKCETTRPEYSDFVLEGSSLLGLRLVGEFVALLG